MRRDARTYLWDAKDACQAILGFVAGLDASGYANNPLVHSAVERKFEIIGEALNPLSKTDAALGARISDLAQIVADHIVHHQVLKTGRFDKVVGNTGQVGMGQIGKDKRLLLELLCRFGGGIEVFFDRASPFEMQIPGPVDRAKPTLA